MSDSNNLTNNTTSESSTTQTPVPDLIITQSFFYRKNATFFARYQDIEIPSNLTSSIVPQRIYPIRFGPLSPLYICKIVEICDESEEEPSSIRCIMYLLQSNYKQTPVKQIIGSNQFLTSTKMVKIPIDLFYLLVLSTELQIWDRSLTADDFIVLKDVNILLIPVTHFFNYCAYRKAFESNVKLRKLINGKRKSVIEDLKLIFFDYTMTIEELTENKRMISFTNYRFNMNTSLLSLRTKSVPHSNNSGSRNSHTKEIPEVTVRPQKRKRGRPSLKRAIPTSSNDDEPVNGNESPSPQSEKQEVPTAQEKQTSSSIASHSPPHRGIRTRSSGFVPELEDSIDDSSLIDEDSFESPQQKRMLRSTKKNRTIGNSPTKNTQGSKKKGLRVRVRPVTPGEEARDQARVEAGIALMNRWNDKTKFIDEYHHFYQNKYKQLPRAPKMGWSEVDFYDLFMQTVTRGGYDVVTNKQLWKDVYRELNSQNVVSNAATTIKTHYVKLMLPFERAYFPNTSASTIENPVGNATVSYDEINGGYLAANAETEPVQKKKFKDFNLNSILNFNEELKQPRRHMHEADIVDTNIPCYTNYPYSINVVDPQPIPYYSREYHNGHIYESSPQYYGDPRMYHNAPYQYHQPGLPSTNVDLTVYYPNYNSRNHSNYSYPAMTPQHLPPSTPYHNQPHFEAYQDIQGYPTNKNSNPHEYNPQYLHRRPI